MWVTYRGNDSYEVNVNEGKIRSKKNGIDLGKRINSNYYVCNIGGKVTTLHRIIWYQANGIIPDGYCVSHIDKNKCNNKINNLEMLTRAETQHKRENKQRPDDYVRNVIELDDVDDFEVLRQNSDYLINPTTGVIVHKKNKKIIGNINLNRYVTVNIGNKTEYLHRVVYKHSFGDIPPKCDIDHIDTNTLNNSIGNLQCLTKSEHRIKTFNDRNI